MFFALFACVTADNYYEQQSAAICLRAEECYKADFDSTWDDQGECVDDYMDLFDELDDCNDHCDFDDKAATSCLSDVKTASCDDLEDGDFGSDCDEVFDCDNSDYTDCVLEKYGF